jgi:hypothetical protein
MSCSGRPQTGHRAIRAGPFASTNTPSPEWSAGGVAICNLPNGISAGLVRVRKGHATRLIGRDRSRAGAVLRYGRGFVRVHPAGISASGGASGARSGFRHDLEPARQHRCLGSGTPDRVHALVASRSSYLVAPAAER